MGQSLAKMEGKPLCRGTPVAGWFINVYNGESYGKMDHLGETQFQETSIWYMLTIINHGPWLVRFASRISSVDEHIVNLSIS